MRTSIIPRTAIALAASLLSAVFLCPSRALAADEGWSREDAAHLLRRAAFGGTPRQIDGVHALGREGAVDYLISGKLPSGVEAPFVHVELSPYQMTFPDNRIQGAESIYELQKLRAWWLDRMVRTDRPLDEKMTLFWHGLFTSGYMEVRSIKWLADQNALFRREAIGNYKRLTREIIHDPAMIKYLNNDENLKGRPNENLARELMELFTMGEGNGYTEKDIPEVARALTGMTIRRRYFGGGGFGGGGVGGGGFEERMHDDGPKTIFGKTGNFMPDDVVDLIFDRQEPADYLAKRLWQFFGQPDPSPEEITPVAEALKNGNWEVAPALRVLFTSPSFYSERSRMVMIRGPVELEVATLRLLEEPPQPRMLGVLAFGQGQLGQSLFQPPNVKGWSGGEHWISSGSVALRYNLASAMANGILGAGFGGPYGMIGFAGRKPPNAKPPEKAALPEKAVPAADGASGTSAENNSAKKPAPVDPADARRQRIDEMRAAERDKVREELAKVPSMPPPEELVVPTKLFPKLGAEPTAGQLVDAAVDRFLQQPLSAEKKAMLIETLGHDPIKLGEPASDRRVRRMIGVLLSTPEFQVE